MACRLQAVFGKYCNCQELLRITIGTVQLNTALCRLIVRSDYVAPLRNQAELNRAGLSQRTKPARVHTAHNENCAIDSLMYTDLSIVLISEESCGCVT